MCKIQIIFGYFGFKLISRNSTYRQPAPLTYNSNGIVSPINESTTPPIRATESCMSYSLHSFRLFFNRDERFEEKFFPFLKKFQKMCRYWIKLVIEYSGKCVLQI